jgi:hypothetical protein
MVTLKANPMSRNSRVALAGHRHDQVDADSKKNALVDAQILVVTLRLALREAGHARISLPRIVAESALRAAERVTRCLETEEAWSSSAS